MRRSIPTDYDASLRLIRGPAQAFGWAALLGVLLALPYLVGTYWLSQFAFIYIYAVAGLGVMLLAGYTGLISIGHAAFLGTGAYTEAYLTARGVAFPLAMAAAALLSAAAGIVIGLPALRVRGMYLAIATLAFGFIAEEAFAPLPAPSSAVRTAPLLPSCCDAPASGTCASHLLAARPMAEPIMFSVPDVFARMKMFVYCVHGDTGYCVPPQPKTV